MPPLRDSATGCMFHSIALGGSWGSGSDVPQSYVALSRQVAEKTVQVAD